MIHWANDAKDCLFTILFHYDRVGEESDEEKFHRVYMNTASRYIIILKIVCNI